MGVSPAGKSLVEAYLGPACLAWAIWCLLRARAAGLERLYFVSRDAFLVWRSAAILAPAFGIECRYLMVSRQAVLPAATTSATRAKLPWLVFAGDRPTYALIFRRLDIEVERCGPRLRSLVAAKGFDARLTPADREAFWLALEEPETRAAVEGAFAGRRRDTVGYFAQEGLLADERWALVDVGWRLTIQRGVHALVRPQASARGLYLHILPERPPLEATGEAEAMFPVRDGREAPVIAKYGLLLEHIVGLAPHGTVLGYARAGTTWQAICQPLSSLQADWQARISDAVAAFASEHGPERLAELVTPEACASAFDAVTRRLLFRPDAGIVRELNEFVALSSDNHNAVTSPLARPIGVGEWIRLMRAGDLEPKRRRQLHWPEGCLRISPAPMRASAWMRRRLAPAAERERRRETVEPAARAVSSAE